jgi:hypothetical protein
MVQILNVRDWHKIESDKTGQSRFRMLTVCRFWIPIVIWLPDFFWYSNDCLVTWLILNIDMVMIWQPDYGNLGQVMNLSVNLDLEAELFGLVFKSQHVTRQSQCLYLKSLLYILIGNGVLFLFFQTCTKLSCKCFFRCIFWLSLLLFSDLYAHRHRKQFVVVRSSIFGQKIERKIQCSQHERSLQSRSDYFVFIFLF